MKLVHMIKSMKDYQKNLFAGLISFLLVLVFLIINNNQTYYYDSMQYYSLSMSFFGGKHSEGFSLFNYPLYIRGITFPFLLFPFNALSYVLFGDTFRGWWLLISLFSGLFTVSFNSIFKYVYKTIYLPIPLILLLVIFYGLFLYPLSDLIAVFFFVYALALIMTAYNVNTQTQIDRHKLTVKQLILFIASGVMLFAAYNTRSIYMFVIPILLMILINNRKVFEKSYLIPIAIIFGFFLLGSVQGFSNLHTMGVFSISTPQITWDDHSSLSLAVLRGGLLLNAQEAYVSADIPVDVMTYWNNSGLLMLQAEDIGIMFLRDFLKLNLKYPIEMLGVYTRHLVLLMNPIQGTPYIYSYNNMRFVYTLFNYSALFIVSVYTYRSYLNTSFKELMKRFKTSSIHKQTCFFFLIALIIPILVSTPVFAEARYGISLWIVIYGLLCYVINIKKEFIEYKKRPLSYAILYILGFAVFISLLTEIYANNSANVLLPILRLL